MKKNNQSGGLSPEKKMTTSIQDVKKILLAIEKQQDQILKKMNAPKTFTIPFSSVMVSSLPNLNLNNLKKQS